MACNDYKDSFVMYGSVLQAAENLNGDEFKECILKIRDYALYGEDKDSDNLLVHTILVMAKPNLKAAADRYQRCVDNGDKGKDYGILGGRPRKGETKEEYRARKGLEKTPRKPLTDTGNENWNEKEKDNINENLNNNDNTPSGGTLQVPSSSSNNISSLLPIDISKEIEEDTKETLDEGDGCIDAPKNKAGASNTSSAGAFYILDYIGRPREEIKGILRGYLYAMAAHKLGIETLSDYEDTKDKAIKCYMHLSGLGQSKAEDAIARGVANYKVGIALKNNIQEPQPQEDKEEEPF